VEAAYEVMGMGTMDSVDLVDSVDSVCELGWLDQVDVSSADQLTDNLIFFLGGFWMLSAPS